MNAIPHITHGLSSYVLWLSLLLGLLVNASAQVTPQNSGPNDASAVLKSTPPGVFTMPFALPFGLGGLIKKGGLGIDASYANSAEGGPQTYANYGYRYMQHEEQLTAQFGSLGLKGGYQYVGPDFAAPGPRVLVGLVHEPTNVMGPVVSAKFALTPKLTITGGYEQYKAVYGNTSSPLQQGDRLNRYQVGLGYGLSSAYAVDLGYEDVEYDLRNNSGTLSGGAGKPRETYLTFGLGHSFTSTASFKLLYQIVRYDDKGTGFDPVVGPGGVAVGQFSIRF